MLELFPKRLSSLRKEKKLSQREAAKVLGVSQALLSHYENGVREPGLQFVAHACDFYGVSADYIMGRTALRCGAVAETPADLAECVAQARLAQELMAQAADAALASRSAYERLGRIINAPQCEVEE